MIVVIKSMLTLSEHMHKSHLFSTLDASERDGLAQKSKLEYIKRGDTIFECGHPAKSVYIVLSGSAKLVRSNPDGKERIVHILLKGELFGAAVAMQGGFYPVTSVALEQSAVMAIDGSIFKSIFLAHPKVGQILVSQLSERIQQAHGDRVAAFDSVEKRIGYFLVELLERVEALYGKTSRIPVPLTRQDIADRIGSTVETVIRTLSQWSKDGLIVSTDRYLEIPSATKLRDQVGF